MTLTTELSIIQPILVTLLSLIGQLILAIVVFIVGYLISVGIGKLIAELLKSVKFNKLFEKEGWRKALQKANVEVNPAEFVGAIFKWIFVIIALFIAVDGLKLDAFSVLLSKILDYLPNVIAAVLIFIVAVIITDVIEKIVRATVERLKVGYGHIVSSIVKWGIWVFITLLILELILPKNLFITTLYSSIVYGTIGALALGIGLAIGLGGKDTAAKIIADMYKKVSEGK